MSPTRTPTATATATPASTEIVHPIPSDEVAGWIRAMAATFLEDPGSPRTAAQIARHRRVWEPERAWGARDRGRWVATLRTETRSMTVPGLGGPGREVIVDALTNVTVAATHRRAGLMSRMLEASLRAARERGDALSILIAAEWPIYGRFGYAPAIEAAAYTLRRSRPGARIAGAGISGEPGRVRQVDAEEFADLAPAVHAATRQWRWAGQLNRTERWWHEVFGRDGHPASAGLPHYFLVHEGDDGPDGMLAWKASGTFGLVPPFGAAEVWDLAAADAVAYRDLWAYLAGIDGIEEVKLHVRPVDEPVRWWLADGRTLVKTEEVDFVWLRILDTPAALAARSYATPGEVVLDVIDGDTGGFAAGRYRLSADGAASACEPTDAPAELELTQRALAAAYLGGTRLVALASTGGVNELSPDALARADLMFSTALPPWNPTWF